MEEQVIYRPLDCTLPVAPHAPVVSVRIPWTTSQSAIRNATWQNMPGDCNQCCWAALTMIVNSRFSAGQTWETTKQQVVAHAFTHETEFARAAGLTLFAWQTEWRQMQQEGAMATDLATLVAAALYQTPMLILDADLAIAYGYIPQVQGRWKHWDMAGLWLQSNHF
eukprot:1142857-Amphidinium_carterae.1